MSVRPRETNYPLLLPKGAGQIGVDIGDRWMCAAQLVGRGEGEMPHLSGALKIARTHEGVVRAREVEMLREAILRAGLKLVPVVINAPDASLLCSTLELPPRASGAPLEQLARLEVARTHKLDPDSFEMALWDLPTPDRVKNMTLAMSMALPKQVAHDTLSAFDEAGVAVDAIDTRACALARVATGAMGDVLGGLVGIVEVGWSATHVALVHAGVSSSPALVYERRIDEVCLRTIVRTLQDRLGIDDRAAELSLRMGEEDDVDHTLADLMRSVRRYQSEFFDLLVPDVQRSFLYASQRYPTMPLVKILLTGEGAGMRGLRGRLASAISVEAALVQPRDVVESAESSTFSRDMCVATAVGLAMHAGVVLGRDGEQHEQRSVA
jgi:Tfp pilus assembly PilM family ATPase